jgi:hypothetical protein
MPAGSPSLDSCRSHWPSRLRPIFEHRPHPRKRNTPLDDPYPSPPSLHSRRRVFAYSPVASARVAFLSAANASLRSSTVSGGNTRTGGGWSISPSVLRAIFCSAMRWSPTDSAHKAAYRHPASHGVGSRLLAARRRRAAKKAASLAKLLDSALFTPRPLFVGIVGTPREERRRSQVPPPAKIRGSPITPPAGVAKARPLTP